LRRNGPGAGEIIRSALREWRTRARLFAHRFGAALAPDNGGPRLLFVDGLPPDPANGAGYPRARAIIQALLNGGWQVECYPMEAPRGHEHATRALFQGPLTIHRSAGAIGLQRLLRERGACFDVAMVSRPSVMGEWVKAVAKARRVAPVPPCLYDAEAIVAVREVSRRALAGETMSAAEIERLIAEEVALVDGVSGVVAVSEAEADAFRRRLSVPVHVIGHGLKAAEATPGPAARKNLLFVGRLTGSREESPNVDSLYWFCEEVVPALDRLAGTWHLEVVGIVDEAVRDALGSERITFHGPQNHLADWYDRARVFVAPTRFAAGIPLKVAEAMGAGLPCVMTKLVAAQMRLQDGVEAGVADGPTDFAERCAQLLREPDHWRLSARTCSPLLRQS
jgi:glycosyltransferase involved in cell wall biosynthesis